MNALNEVNVYVSGLVHCSVCAPADMPIEAVTAAVNILNPTGLAHGWHLSEDTTFANGDPMPRSCNSDDNRLHYLFTC